MPVWVSHPPPDLGDDAGFEPSSSSGASVTVTGTLATVTPLAPPVPSWALNGCSASTDTVRTYSSSLPSSSSWDAGASLPSVGAQDGAQGYAALPPRSELSNLNIESLTPALDGY